MRRYLAEFLGTYGLVFFGTGAIIVNDITSNSFGLTGIAIAFGLIVAVMIYTFGSISGAHINPAVTIAFTLKKKLDLKDCFGYIICQIIGAIAASFTLHFLFRNHQTLGMTLPSGTVLQSFIMEYISTFFMMFTILGVTKKGNSNTKSLAGIVIGFVILAMIFVAGPVSGGAFNPARSIGPAVVVGNYNHLWIYLTAPIFGTVTAVFVWNFLFEKVKISN